MAIDPETVERYQIEYQKNPKSRVFAPLAEAYRQMGLLEEAYQICTAGVELHPDFPGGLVAMARILIDKGDREGALMQLKKCTKLAPDNLLAHTLMGDLYLEMRNPKEALKAFKMVLFLNPSDEKAQKIVRKWEFLSAEDFDDELFEMKPVFQAVPPPEIKPLSDDDELSLDDSPSTTSTTGPDWRASEIERAVSIADAYIIRGENARAIEILRAAEDQLGPSPEFEKRLEVLEKEEEDEALQIDTLPLLEVPLSKDRRARRIRQLEDLLRRINERRFR